MFPNTPFLKLTYKKINKNDEQNGSIQNQQCNKVLMDKKLEVENYCKKF